MPRQRCLHETSKERVGTVRTGFKLRMSLGAHKEWMLLQLNHFYYPPIRGAVSYTHLDVYKRQVFMLCRVLGGSFQENSETVESGYFSREELPPLAEEKTTAQQVYMCFEACGDENWKPLID